MRILLSLFFCLTTIPFSAQHFRAFNSPLLVSVPNSLAANKAGGGIYVNLDISDELQQSSLVYKHAIWPINEAYDTLASDSLITRVIQKTDTLIDVSNTYTYSMSSFSLLSLDSVSLVVGHEKNTFYNDTLFMQILEIGNSGYPTNQILFSDTLVISSPISPSNQWTETVEIVWPVNFIIPPQQGFAIQFIYRAPLEDTLGVAAGFATQGLCNNLDAARWSSFYPNSYAYWTGFNALIPTYAGGDLYYDCNQNNQFDTLTDGRNFIQNWSVGMYISSPELNAPVNIFENEIKVFPNPVNEVLHVESLLPLEDVIVYDMQGTQLVLPVKENSLFFNNLSNGLYIIKVLTSKGIYAQKILVTH
jgi:hypothetical protein